MDALFGEFALLLVVSALAGAIAVRLRQPVLIAYIVVGVAASPAGFGLVEAHDQITLLAQIGVAVLLFVVGLRLDLNHVRLIGPVALATGLGQIAATVAIGFALVYLMGRSVMEALYVAVALTFSSTIIIVKLLSDKRELDTLHGRIAVGILIVQDIAVVLAMMAMSALRGAGEAPPLELAATLGLRVAAAALLLYGLMRYVLPRLVEAMARSQELLLVFAIAWGTGLAALGEWAGFSREAGAFLAGFSLASTAYREAMSARLTGIRDFLLLFFFIDLGARLDLATLGDALWPAALLAAFVLAGKPLILMAIMGYLGYRKRTGLLVGLTMAQISEFSIVFVALGATLGHVDAATLNLTTLTGVITFTLSTYLILYAHVLYEKLSPWLGVFERRRPFRELAVERQRRPEGVPEAIVFGLGRYGSRLLARLGEQGIRALGVDFDPEAVRALRRQGLAVRFGDSEDPDFLETLGLQEVPWVVTTLPQWESNRAFLHALRAAGFKGRVAGVVRDEAHAVALGRLGVERVLHV
ncbi:MAG TPA: cation:proton antiporter family protein, partial [Burkholderiales bacterium]|nr:cation:proton antiporter family protein [Burkholderiales bacterium]